ncbi:MULTISPECIES: CBS domain-containing protein [Streptomyces]|uniref:CBS domain-containing protein n=2 Tax=Streptomyces TaxID=1883 RepID=A0ABV9IXG5_9ACTN
MTTATGPLVCDDTRDDATGPRVSDDMTVEVALSVMADARVEVLYLCDADHRRTGSVTRPKPVAVRAVPAYPDRIRLRDVSPIPLPL